MVKAGCTEVSLGFESGSERMLRLMNKRFTPEDIRRASEMLADHGIHQMGFLLPALAKTALKEGKITRDDDLLFPRFYIVSGLEDWLRATVGEWMAARPHWMT